MIPTILKSKEEKKKNLPLHVSLDSKGNKLCVIPVTSQSPGCSTSPPLKAKCLGLKAGL